MALTCLAPAPGPNPPAVEELLAGTTLRPLLSHRDARGALAEFYRDDWAAGPPARQWAMTVNEAGVLRGMHVHFRHHDYFVLIQGRCTVGLYDLRPGSPTHRRPAQIELRGERPALLTIPPGVAHGFYFPVTAIYTIGLTEYYDPSDELGCTWRDPALGIEWGTASPRLSERDAALPSLSELACGIPRWPL